MPREAPGNNTPAPSARRARRSTGVSDNAVERRIVTALYYDLVGSTELFHQLDIEDYSELISTFQNAANHSIASHSGFLRVEAGDGGLALFPVELGPRDAASLAIRAGLEIVAACERIGREARRSDLHVRVGIATSVAIIQSTRMENWTHEPVTGAALAMATRLQAIAAPNSVFVSEETRNLAGRSHAFTFQGTRTLKGFVEPEKVWRAVGHKNEVGRFYAFGRVSGAFIGRTDALNTIANSWKKVLAGNGEILFIEGDAGIGKSRLLREFRRMTRDQRSRFFSFQCLPGAFGSTLHPLVHSFAGGMSDAGGQLRLTASAVADRFERHGVRDAEVIEIFTYLLGALGRNEDLANSEPKAIREKARRAVFRALEAVCQNGPIVLAVEDIHWIDPTSQDLLAETARVLRQFPALLIVTSRPNPSMNWLDEATPMRISLQPLDRGETKLAIEKKWPEHRLAMLPELLDLTERISGGVPLFIEEICKWVSESAEANSVKMSGNVSPTHVSAFAGILDARLNQLGSVRDVARAGAVAGSRFTLPLLRELLPDFGKKALASATDTLCETGFLTRVRASRTITYGFRHALIQETIYNALLRKQRQAFHRRLFGAVSRNREIAPWIDSGALAAHAERADLLQNAVELFIEAGKEGVGRSAMVEARHHLEHALAVCGQMSEVNRVDLLQLSALTALGPVLTGMVGLNSPPARQLYEEGVAIARRLPKAEQSKWFPIYWGWWLTGSDFLVMHERAMEVQTMLSDVDDPEIRLQLKHCIWAIDFNLGWHRETQDAIKRGLALYDEHSAKTARTLYGGHDAKVCGLGQLALSLWLTGQFSESDRTLSEMVAFVDGISHAPSKAHSLDTEAVSAFYRNDYQHLTDIAGRMAEFAKQHEMQSLSGLSLLFGGWAEAHLGNLADGHERFRNGLELLTRLGAVIDLPIYLCMHSTMLGLAGKSEMAIEVATEAIDKAKETGHAYWLAELYRARAMLHAQANATRDLIVADLHTASAIAESQGAAALRQRANHSLRELGFVVEH